MRLAVSALASTQRRTHYSILRASDTIMPHVLPASTARCGVAGATKDHANESRRLSMLVQASLLLPTTTNIDCGCVVRMTKPSSVWHVVDSSSNRNEIKKYLHICVFTNRQSLFDECGAGENELRHSVRFFIEFAKTPALPEHTRWPTLHCASCRICSSS